MFCAIATTIERCKTEGVVDIFQVVKALRVQKPGAILNVVSTQQSWSQAWGLSLLGPDRTCMQFTDKDKTIEFHVARRDVLVLTLFLHIRGITLKDVYIIITWLSSTYNCTPTLLEVTNDKEIWNYTCMWKFLNQSQLMFYSIVFLRSNLRWSLKLCLPTWILSTLMPTSRIYS